MAGETTEDRGDGDRGETLGQEGGNHAAVQSFYGQWAGLYDAIAEGFPRIAAVRRQAADACRLEAGDTVVEMGCGTGTNLRFLREAVGPTGRVVGVDVTRPMLDRARRRHRDDDAVHLVHGDAAAPPIEGPVDAVLATFVSGMFRDPARVVHGWCDLVADGHVVLVDAAPSKRASAGPLNAAFRAATVLSTPPTLQFRYEEDVTGTLDRRVSAAHGAVRERASGVASAEHLLGFVRLTGGRIG